MNRERTILLSRRRLLPGLGLLLAAGLAACVNDTATGVGDDLLPIRPQTIEVLLPWSEFGVDSRVFGGFGRASEIADFVLAHEYQGVLEARALASFIYPASVNVVDTTGTLVVDSTYTPVGARLVATFDTLSFPRSSDVAANVVYGIWDPVTTTWEAEVDSVGEFRPWPEPGAGPAERVGEEAWFPDIADSVTIDVDSLTARIWGDTTVASGVRLDLTTPGRTAELVQLALDVDVRPSAAPDTVVTFTAITVNVAFIYSPEPDAPTGEIRFGGAPAWRTVMEINVPKVLNGPPSLCAQVTCPFVVDPTRVNLATLRLTTALPEAGFRPADSVFIDARTVLLPSRLPKSPLGSPLVPTGVAVPPEAFNEEVGTRVEVPLTGFVRTLLTGETSSGSAPPSTFTLLDGLEPNALSFASFVGPGGEGEPTLRMIVTTADTLVVR